MQYVGLNALDLMKSYPIRGRIEIQNQFSPAIEYLIDILHHFARRMKIRSAEEWQEAEPRHY
jgi:hypothetical protein